jgi:hypothetical protein
MALAEAASKEFKQAGISLSADSIVGLDRTRRAQTAGSRAGALSRKEFWNAQLNKIFADVPQPIPPVLSDYEDLLHVDMSRKTIHHAPDFQVEFARTVGGHSECVGRRIARYLWELHKQDVAAKETGGKRPRGAERPDDLMRDVQAMRYLLAPCHPSQEQELQERVKSLGERGRTLDAALKRHEAIIAQQREIAERIRARKETVDAADDKVRALEVAAELREAEREGARIGGIDRGHGTHLVPNGRTLMLIVPSPIVILFAAKT